MRTLFSEDMPDPRDIALICLIDAGNLLSSMLSRQELDAARERIDLIRRMDLIGRTVAAAIETMVVEVVPPPSSQIRPVPQFRPGRRVDDALAVRYDAVTARERSVPSPDRSLTDDPAPAAPS